MNNNNNLRQNELLCLNKIRNNYIFSRGMNFNKVFDNCDYFVMKSMLNSARQNDNHDIFPDFFFDGGIIEHFEVTASKESNDGSKYKVDDARFRRENEKYFDQLDKEFKESPPNPGTVKTESVINTHEGFSYEYFVKSFKRNAERHLASLSKSEFLNQVVVFLIEQQSAALSIYSNNKFDRFYKLSEDKNLLSYIKETFSGVNYIIFNVTNSYEIIDLSKIDSMIAVAKENLDIRGERQKNVTLKFLIDL